jgi:hypothetical protein
MIQGATRYPRIPVAAPAMYIHPIVRASVKSARKLEFEYIGIAR